MLRVHAMQLFYNLSDPAMEDALYEIDSMRRFAGLDLTRNLPDETTILKFRHLLEKHGLARKIFECINDELRQQGLLQQQRG
jgi:IS5 family transposase